MVEDKKRYAAKSRKHGAPMRIIDSDIEGRQEPSETIRSSGRRGGKKGAGNVGDSNVNHS